MTHSKILLLGIVISVAGTFPSVSAADVRISLNNGRTIRADSCKDVGAKLICEKPGGSFEIEKKDVLNLSEIKTAPHYYRQTETSAPETGTTAGVLKDSPGKEGKKEAASEQENRLNQITARKKELQAEREKLELERKQLEQDMKNAPQQLAPLKFDELNRRNIALEEKIKKFNAEVQALDKEENSIAGSIRNPQ